MSGAARDARLRLDGRVHATSVRLEGETATGTVDGRAVVGRVRAAGRGAFTLHVEGRRHLVAFERRGGRLLLSVDGRVHEIGIVDPSEPDAGAEESVELLAVSPMAGLVTKVHVRAGEAVTKGAPLFAVEAMKMEYVVRAERDVTIADVHVVAGARIGMNEPAVRFASGAPG